MLTLLSSKRHNNHPNSLVSLCGSQETYREAKEGG